MAYFVYTPENPIDGVSENLSLVAKDFTEERKLILNLIEEAPEEITDEELDRVVDANPARLPVGILSRLLALIDIPIVDAISGLGLYSTWRPDNETGVFEVFTTEVYAETEALPVENEGEWPVTPQIASDITRDPTFAQLVADHRFTHYAFQIQTDPEGRKGETIDHYSLGFSPPDGGYIAMATVIARVQ